jgi:hypothetical protein
MLTICRHPSPELQYTVAEQILRSLEISFDELRLAIPWLICKMEKRLETNHTATRAITEAILFKNFEEEFESNRRELTYHIQRLIKGGLTHTDIYNNHQAKNLSRLTILATCVLPLSISATVLSMQTRFVNLGILLYGLVAVTFLLIFIALTVFLGSKRIIVSAREEEIRLIPRATRERA